MLNNTNESKKFLFILNPISGGLDKAAFKEELQKICIECNIDSIVFETIGEADEQLIQQQIDEHQPKIVIACGGDGTINLVAKVMLGKDIPMGIVPLGSANGLATELTIPTNLQENIDLLTTGKVIHMDVLLINGEHLCLHLSDVGFNAKLVQEFEDATGRGKLTYAWGFIKTIMKKEGIRSRITTPEIVLRQKMEMITFANARKYGTGALINPNGKVDDGRFEICVFEPYPRWQLPHLTYLFFTGRLNNSKYVEILSTTKGTISLAKPQPLQVDGEMIGETTEITVELHPDKLQLIVPETYE